MIIILFPFVAFFAGIAGLLISAAWWSLSLMFGIIPPTPEQTSGIVLGVIVLSQFGLAGTLAWAILMDGR